MSKEQILQELAEAYEQLMFVFLYPGSKGLEFCNSVSPTN